MCIEIIRLLFSPLRAALSKSCKSPEVSIINVYLGASPEIALRAPQKQRLSADVLDWGLTLCWVIYLHQTSPCKSFCCQPWKLFCPREKVFRIRVRKPRVESQPGPQWAPCHSWQRTPYLCNGRGNSLWFTGLLERAQRHSSTECCERYKGQGGDQHYPVPLCLTECWLHEDEKAAYYKKPFSTTSVANEDTLESCP